MSFESYSEETYSEFIRLRTYARWLPKELRRETWDETVNRYCDYVFSQCKNADAIPEKVKQKIKSKILNKEVMPSMRALWSAGSAADNNNASMYNCSALAIDSLDAFSNAVLLLMNGAGVGFSVSRKFIAELPTVRFQKNMPIINYTIEDSKEGWAEALRLGLELWFDGRDIQFDYSKVRPLGTPLQTFGGYASGPEPLRQMLDFTRDTITKAQNRQLTSLECHDIMCEIGSVVVSGGSRRSSLVSLSDLNDEYMMEAKIPPFHPRRFLSNNSAIYEEKPNVLDFLDEWASLAKSGTGERGIFNLLAARKNAPHRRKSKLIELGNPCMEIMLRPYEFCNLSEVVIRADMDFDDLRDSITTAVWIGLIQSTFTNFPDLDPRFKENCEEERLIGVSLTGQMDNPDLLSEQVLDLLKKHAVKTARHGAKLLDINTPAACTTSKPSGTVSNLVNSSSGLHPRWSQYYIRRVRISKSDPLYKMMVDQGIISHEAPENNDTAVFEFPVKSPDNCITRHDMSAIDQLNHYVKIVNHWTEHNASCTVYVKPEEWLGVASFVYDNFDKINGVSFFPYSEHNYKMAPYEDIDEQTYLSMVKEFPKIDYSKLSEYESTDNTLGAKELACAGGACEL